MSPAYLAKGRGGVLSQDACVHVCMCVCVCVYGGVESEREAKMVSETIDFNGTGSGPRARFTKGRADGRSGGSVWGGMRILGQTGV